MEQLQTWWVTALYMPIDGDSCMEIPGDCEVVKAAAAQATIATLQARVRELEQWVQDQSTANLEKMQHMDEMQSRAMDAESQLTQRTAELARVRDQYADLRKMVLALPKVEGEIVYQSGLGWIIRQDSKWEPIPEFGRGLRASLLQHRQGMEG